MINPLRTSRFFNGLRFLSDICLIPVIIVLAYVFKFKIGWILQNIFYIQKGVIYSHAQIEPYLQVSGLIILLWVLTFYSLGLYQNKRGLMVSVDEFIDIVKGVTIVTFEAMALTFLFRTFPESRYVLMYVWILGITILTTSRLIIYKIEMSMLMKGVGGKNAIIIGGQQLGQDLAESMIQIPNLRYRYCGTLDEVKPEKIHFHLRGKMNYLGRPDQYKKIIREQNINAIFITNKNIVQLDKLVDYTDKQNVEVYVVSEDSPYLKSLAVLRDINGLPFILFNSKAMPRVALLLKRVFDIFFSALALMMLLPVLIPIALWVKVVSPHGPLFYVQERVTLNNRKFGMIKFRTMVPDAETLSGPTMVDERGDSRYIKGGGLLRKYSLDELPQLFNVLKGDMSIVGPRPERPFFIEQFEKEIPHFNQRHYMKGGITGWAQINGRSVLTRRPDHKFLYDMYYIKNFSLLFDIKIILKTIQVVFLSEEAY